MIRRSFSVLGVFLCCSFLTQIAYGQLPVDTLLTIGDDESAEAEYLFADIRQVMRSQNGMLYVSDLHLDHVRVFNPDGTFDRKIGRRGEGPGEFAQAQLILLTNDGQLFVRDRRTHRVAVFDSVTDELLDTLTLGHFQRSPPELTAGDWPVEMRLHEGPNGTFIMPAMGAPDVRTEGEIPGSAQKLFTVLRSDLSSVTQFFGSFEMVHMPHFFARVQANVHVGHAILTADNMLWYAPGPYNGEVFTFAMDGDSWSRAARVDGMSVRGPIYEEVEPEERPDTDRYLTVRSIVGRDLQGRLLRSSAGLVQAPDGSILHFAYHIGKDDRGTVTVERFSPEGILVAVQTVLGNLPALGKPAIEIRGIDEDGNLYTIDRTGDAPVIRVLSVQWPE